MTRVNRALDMYYYNTIFNILRYNITTIQDYSLITKNHHPNSYRQLFLLPVVSYRTKFKGPTKRKWQRRWWRSSNSNRKSSNRRGKRLSRDLFLFFLFLSVKEENEVKSMIWNLCERKLEMMSAQRNGGASDIAFTPTPTPTPQSMLLLLLLHKQKKKAFNGRRHNNKYVSVLMDDLPYSIHIQFFS